MKILILLLALFSALNAQNNERVQRRTKSNDSEVVCAYEETDTMEFRKTMYEFAVKMYKSVARHGGSHFVFSPISLWLSLAAIAEGTDGLTAEELKQFLVLPEDECMRESFYKIASTREPVGQGVTLARARVFFVDEELSVNSQWENFAITKCKLITARAPIRRNPQMAAIQIRHAISSQLASLNLQGNSVLADSLDYHGLWSEAFSEASIVRSPFYDHKGDQVGSVDMMKMKKRMRATFSEQLNAKVFEIPVGHQGRYRMIFCIPETGHAVRTATETMDYSVVFEIVENLKESLIPIEIGIPRFLISSEVDVRTVLEDLGLQSLWTDALATGNISQPAANPSSFIQRVQISIDSHGVNPPIPDYTTYTSSDTGLDARIGKEIILDRPFMFGFFDTETYTNLFAAAFSAPTYKL